MNKPNPGLFIFFLLKVLDGFHFFILFFSPLLAVRIISFPPRESDYLGKAPGNQTARLKRGIILDTTTEMNL